MDPNLLLLALTAVGVIAGFVDSIAGGGGLLTVPALLLTGIDPVTALGTNKLQGSFGSGSATLAYARRGLIDFRSAWPMAAMAFVGAAAGTAAVQHAPISMLQVLPLLLIAMALYFAFTPKLADADAKPRLSPALFAATAALGVGFYDGMFGPGAGSFYFLAFVLLLGTSVVRGTAHTKLLNFTSNIAALLGFALTHHVLWTWGAAMGVGQFVGAQIGARVAIRHGSKIIRPLLVLVCCAMALKLLLDPKHPLHVWLLGP